MSFKEHIAADINAVFLNDDEFAESVIIGGKTYTVVVDEERLKERQATDYNGIFEGEVLYFIAASALDKMPKVGESQIFRGRPMFVADVQHDMGMYEVILSQNRSG